MLTMITGHDTKYLTDAVAGGREGYYTGAVAAGEPAGLWYGAGAELLGLSGEVDAELMEAMYSRRLDPRDPAARDRKQWNATALLGKANRNYRSADEAYQELLEREPHAGPERRAELRGQAEEIGRENVSFFDATFSPVKSVTVLGVAFERAANDARARGELDTAAAWSAHQKAVEDAVMAGARASIDYLQDVAGYSRVGKWGGGAGRFSDAHSFVVAQFLQHDSRDRDPQLHVHQAILNRVQCADGQWRTLDSKALNSAHKFAAGALGTRVMEAHLTRSLGVRFATRPDGVAREVIGVPQAVMDMFSSRRQKITAKAEKLLDAYRAEHGREPTLYERTKIAQQATLATRKAKTHDGETLSARMQRWDRQIRSVVHGGLSQVANAVLGRAQHTDPADTWSERDVIDRALDAVGEGRQTWTRADLFRAVSNCLPGHLTIDPEKIRTLLDTLTDTALAEAVLVKEEESTDGLGEHLLLANGKSVYQNPTGARYATQGQISAEETLRQAAVRRGAARIELDEAQRLVAAFAESGVELGADQAAALTGVLTSGARIEVLTAPAGAGKSFVVGAINDGWQTAGHRVFGLATSQNAAEILAGEGLNARNVTRWLDAQRRLEKAKPGGVDSYGDEELRLRSGDLVVVDEASMTDTGSLVEIHRRCDAAGAKLLLVGDPRQLQPVGPGGALAEVAAHGISYELTEIRRFQSEWERTASLGLREGDVSVLDEYAKHGRLVECGAVEQAEAAAARAWLADTLNGRDALVLAPTNEAADRMAAALRAELVSLGLVAEDGVPLPAHGAMVGVGDLIQARRNGLSLIGYDGNTTMPVNRKTYRVQETREDGSMVVALVAGRENGTEVLGPRMTLPAEYVAEHVALGYASTAHAAEGRTVDTGAAVIGPGTDAAAAYVMPTRGRIRNTMYVVTRSAPADAETGEVNDVTARRGTDVIADILTEDHGREVNPNLSALAQHEHESEAAKSTQVSLERLAVEIAEATAGRTSTLLDRLTATGALPAKHRKALAADEAHGSLERLLRTVEVAGHDPAAVLEAAVAERSLDEALHPARVLHRRITAKLEGQLTPQVRSYADLIPPGVPEHSRARLEKLAHDADTRRHELGERAATEPPQWVIEALGPVPDDAMARADWEDRAGWAAAYRELSGHDDETNPLGTPPPAGLAENFAAWRVAHTALDLPDFRPEEAQLSDGRLRSYVRAMDRETQWAPRYVADELAATNRQADKAHEDATVWAARAEVATDATERELLRAEAAKAAAQAEELQQRIADLEVSDQARAKWFAATSPTRDAAERARVQLSARGIDPDTIDDHVTAEEWLAEHEADQHADELDRPIRDEAELHDPERDQHTAIEDTDEREQQAVAEATEDIAVVETEVPDIREVAIQDENELADPQDRHRIPTADETAEAVRRAQEALAEIDARHHADQAREAEEDARRGELARWADDDRAEQAAAEVELEEAPER